MLLYYYLSSLSSSLPVVFFILFRRKILFDTYQLKLLVFVVYKLITDILGLIFETYFPSAYPVFHFTVLCDFIFYSEIFAEVSQLKNKYLRLIQLGILLIAIFEGLIIGTIWENNWITTISSYSVISIMYFLLLANTNSSMSKSKLGFTITVFVYFSIMMVYFVFEEIIRKDFSVFIFLEPFILTLYVLFNLSLSYIICTSPKK